MARTVSCILALLLLAWLPGTPPARAVETEPARPAAGVEIRVLSYNVRAIPLLTDLDRLKRIGEVLRERRRQGDEPDVVLLQEAFSKKSRRIRNRGGYPHSYVGPDGHPLFKNASGLEILSNFPIRERFRQGYGQCAGADCLVRKAVQGVELDVPGVPSPILILNTHLQAQSNYDAVRGSQIGDLEGFLETIGYSRPLIFGGDFNFKPRHPSYHRFVQAFPFSEAGRFCLDMPQVCEVHVGANGRTDERDVWQSSHDRQFFYGPVEAGVRIEPVRVIRNFTQKRDGDFLSDHWGYEVHYRIVW